MRRATSIESASRAVQRNYDLTIREDREPVASATEARSAVDLLNNIYKKAGVGPYFSEAAPAWLERLTETGSARFRNLMVIIYPDGRSCQLGYN